jgi:hypothetical protein
VHPRLLAQLRPQSRSYGAARAATLEEYESPSATVAPAVDQLIEVDAAQQDESLLIAKCGLNVETVKVRGSL